MIERLTGTCVAKQITGIVLDVNGVGYGVEMTDAALAAIDVGEGPLTVWVHTHVREDALRLFGFQTFDERQLFTMLISLTGVGPKLAMGILGRLSAAQLAEAVEREDADQLEEVPGIGARQSKKILLELKPKIQKLLASGALATTMQPMVSAAKPAVADEIFGAAKKKTLDRVTVTELQSALENFGYKDKELAPVLKKFERQPPATDLTTLIRLALAELSGARRGEGSAKGDQPLKELF